MGFMANTITESRKEYLYFTGLLWDMFTEYEKVVLLYANSGHKHSSNDTTTTSGSVGAVLYTHYKYLTLFIAST